MRKFWNGAADPAGPSIDAQSGSAEAIPYGCHGRPQWNRPPMYSNVIQCMWPSTSPPTGPNDVAPRDGVPVALKPASGNTAQPDAFSNRTGPTFAPDADVIVPSSSTRQSAAALGAATAP